MTEASKLTNEADERYAGMTMAELEAASRALVEADELVTGGGKSADDGGAVDEQDVDEQDDDEQDDDEQDAPGEAIDTFDLEASIVDRSELTDDGTDGDDDVVDVHELLRRVRAAVREEFERLGRRQRERVREAVAQKDSPLASRGVRFALALKATVYGWSDQCACRALEIAPSTLRKWKHSARWKADLAQLQNEKAALRANLLAVINSTDPKTTPGVRTDAARQLAQLTRTVVPRYVFATERERADWLESL